MTADELLVLCVVIMVGMAAGMLSAFTAGWRLGLDTVRDQDRVILEVLNRIERPARPTDEERGKGQEVHEARSGCFSRQLNEVLRRNGIEP